MKALVLFDAEKIEAREISQPEILPHEILLQVGAVGLCGTDFHIYEGKANYNFDSSGHPIPLQAQPQILGHEFCGTVVEIGSEVKDLKIGDRVIADQGINCSSRGLSRNQWCEYCATDCSHQCLQYDELGLTGKQGALAEFIALPATNAIRIETGLPFVEAALCEPLGCIIHASQMHLKTSARYTFAGERSIKSILICGAGPAGLLFTQYLRNVIGYEGLLIVSEPNKIRRNLVSEFGAVALDPITANLIEAVNELTHGEKIHYLIESAGAAQIFPEIPGLLRKQGTLMMYGHGHHGVDLGALNAIQFLEPTLISPCGASGALNEFGKPETHIQALNLVSDGKIEVSRFITHRYSSLESAINAFSLDRFDSNYIKGVAALN